MSRRRQCISEARQSLQPASTLQRNVVVSKQVTLVTCNLPLCICYDETEASEVFETEATRRGKVLEGRCMSMKCIMRQAWPHHIAGCNALIQPASTRSHYRTLATATFRPGLYLECSGWGCNGRAGGPYRLSSSTLPSLPLEIGP